MIFERRLIREPNFGLTGKLLQVNWIFVLLLMTLAGVGYAALYSAGGGAPEPYAAKHLMRFALGLIIMISMALIDIRFLARLSWPIYIVSIVLLVLVLKLGHSDNGARRWLVLAGQQVQPSELAKVALIMVLASWFHKASWERIGNPFFLIPPVLMILLPVGLILKEPNLGTAAITAMVGGAVMLGAGVRWWKFVLVAIAGGIAAPIAYGHLHDYQRARITTFLNPESDPLGAGYNIIQSKIALGSGGMWGQGYLHGTQAQLNFLPEKETDFIFTMWSEEMGFVGGAGLMVLLLAITLGAMLVALRCRNQFGRLVAMGISVNFFLYVFVNIAMATGAIPVGGVPLPLVSHGGSAMLVVMFAMGLLMSVHVHRDTVFETGDERP